jgi:hypothetical protein
MEGGDGSLFCTVGRRDPASASRINAVRVETGRAAGAPGGGAVPVFMSGLLGTAGALDVRAGATALAGGPEEAACPPVPLVIRSRCLVGEDGLRCGQELRFGAGGGDQVGWTEPDRPGNASPNAHAVCRYLRERTGCSVRDGQQLGTSRGTGLGSHCPRRGGGGHGGGSRICDWFADYERRDVQVPVVDSGGGGCSGYGGSATVVGFATIRITRVDCGSQLVQVRLLCDRQDRDRPGGGWYGTYSSRPVLVR